jgi:hypothetical protein
MSGPVRVFVSHHHSPQEDAFTARLVADLDAVGADVWVDAAGITSGSFVAKISEGLAHRQSLVLVMTPASLASQWVRLEVDIAIAEQRAGRMLGVIPFVMLPCKDTDIPHLWRTFQRYDATKNYEAARDGVLRALGLSLPRVTDDLQLARQGAASKPTSADATAPPAGATQKVQQPNLARLKSMNRLRSLSHTKFIDAVAIHRCCRIDADGQWVSSGGAYMVQRRCGH